MELLDKFKVKEYSGQPVTVAQVKFDGYYAEVYKNDADGIVVCTKKQNENLWPKLQRHDGIRKQLEQLPNDTILRCELHAFGVQATSVPTLINDADPLLLLSPFKIEMFQDSVMPLGFGYEYELLVGLGFIVPNWFELNGIDGVAPELKPLTDFDVHTLEQRAYSTGVEGWVVKDVPGGNCWKIKPVKTVDAFVMGHTVSDSDSFYGGLKAVQIGVMDGDEQVEIASCGSGFEKEYRMSVDLASLAGKVGEFEYQDVAAKGRLKFPRFLRWRDDEKQAKDCTKDQLC